MKKYQIRLKSAAGPIEVLLVNKDPSSPSPVVLPVPPPEDILQNLPAPNAAPAPCSKPTPPPGQPPAPSSNPSPAMATPGSTVNSATSQTASTEVTSNKGSSLAAAADTPARPTPLLDTQTLQSSASLDGSSPSASSAVFEPIKADPSELLDFPKELSEMFDPTKEMSADLLEELMSSEVFSPLLRLSPPPGDHDYVYNLDETEGLCDLFDVPIFNL